MDFNAYWDLCTDYWWVHAIVSGVRRHKVMMRVGRGGRSVTGVHGSSTGI